MTIERPKIYRKWDVLDGLSERQKKHFINARDGKTENSPFGGGKSIEPQPKIRECKNEKTVKGYNNSSISFGTDRPGSCLSGYSRGDTHAGRVDIVAGRMGHKAKSVTEDGEEIFADPSFRTDAARVYISQKTDVDDNFQLVDGKNGNSKARSAVAIKADAVRLISREGIKLIASGVDDINSQGGKINTRAFGIDLIAGNNDKDLQPIPKGQNLVGALRRLTHHVDKLGGIVDAFLHSQVIFNQAVSVHTHISPFFGIPVSLSPGLTIIGPTTVADQVGVVKSSLLAQKANLAGFRLTYLSPAGAGWICSYHNNTN